MRFDDSLTTVLAADATTASGALAAWRQLVDLVARDRAPDVAGAIARLRDLRGRVPLATRVATARGLAETEPPAALIAFFADDDPAAAAPALRTARLDEAEWLALLPRLSPAGRAVLRHRRDLPGAVLRGLASFGATDFVLGHDAPPAAPPHADDVPAPLPIAVPGPASTPFTAVGEIARALPLVAEAQRLAAGAPQFAIADLVARIDAFQRDRPPPAPPATPVAADSFRFAADELGIIRWVDGVARGALVGVDLRRAGAQGVATVDDTAALPVRAREAFRNVQMDVAGDSTAAGKWRLAACPSFDRATGRFLGFDGIARRATTTVAVPASDSLRQLVHELRTPANAISGFAELIGTELLGPVTPVYRERARLIELEAAALVTAIDDLDTAARLQGNALALRPGTVDLAPLLERAIADLQPLAVAAGATFDVAAAPAAPVWADDRVAARLVDRLLLAALATAEPGEMLRAHLVNKPRGVRLHVTRPRALPVADDEALLVLDTGSPLHGGPLLGPGFTLRLVRQLAAAAGGSLAITPERLTLRLPAALTTAMERTATQ